VKRLSLNSMTADRWSLAEVVDACAEYGVEWVGPWRHKLDDVEDARRRIDAAGLKVSSLCRGGFFAAEGADDDNRSAVEQAAALGTDVLVLVCGPPRTRDLAAARRVIEEGIERLLPYAREHGVRLGIEPLHPMMIGERSAIVTLGEALDLARRFAAPQDVGVVVDAYHVFWDPRLEPELAGADGLVAAYHVCDWLVPTTDLLAGRGLMGDGIIDLPRVTELVVNAEYNGPVEVEVINPALADVPPGDLLADIQARFARIG
jgi:sugar phosphate isomerase/epimerase